MLNYFVIFIQINPGTILRVYSKEMICQLIHNINLIPNIHYYFFFSYIKKKYMNNLKKFVRVEWRRAGGWVKPVLGMYN